MTSYLLLWTIRSTRVYNTQYLCRRFCKF